MRLVIAEKPSVARDIARALGGKATPSKGQSYIDTPDYTISWALGHLIGLVDADAYDPSYKRWRLEHLPILPETFQLRVLPKTTTQFRVLLKLLREADLVVNACDAGREGELIFRQILTAAGYRGKVQRLWLSALTPDAIRAGFARLKSGSDYDRLAAGARCRSEADWLVGINATRALTCRHGELLTCGRVQTPTLALVVEREKAILAFVPETYFEVHATFQTDPGEYTGVWVDRSGDLAGREQSAAPRTAGSEDEPATEGMSEQREDAARAGTRLPDRESAARIVARVKGQTGVITQVERRREKEWPLRLFDLTDLQRTANRRFGYTAKHTLDKLQSLYEKHKAITYPRTDSAYLSHELVPSLERRLAAGSAVPGMDVIIAALPKPLPIHRRFVDDTRVTDHHAIIPTERTPKLASLSEDERKLYELIVRRFTAVFFPPAVWERTTVTTTVGIDTFLSRGKVLVEPGWRIAEQEGPPADEPLLPPLEREMDARVKEVRSRQKKTEPPKRYTEATLLRAMETCGRDTDFADVMKARGLGTPATRAAILERLKDVGYIQVKGRQIHPTEKGMGVIEAIPVAALTSAELTGEWEQALREIEEGSRTADAFMQQVRRYAVHIVEAVRQSSASTALSSPRSGKTGTRRASASPSRSKRARAATGSRSKRKNTAPAHVDESPAADDARTSASTTALQAGIAHEGLMCPLCGGAVVERPKFWSCQNWKQGCGLKVWKEMSKRTFSSEEIEQLLRDGATGPLQFVSPRTQRPFSARVRLQNGVPEFEFA